MAKRYQGPQRTDIRKNLSDLIAEGLVPYNVVEKGGDLLKLNLVADRLAVDPSADEDELDRAYCEALSALLRDAVRDPRMRRLYRRVLTCVLPLSDRYAKASVQERRSAAGKEIKDGTKIVKAGTIRTYHEPRALDALASILVAMEAERRGEQAPADETLVPA
jgi:hypothetical protein